MRRFLATALLFIVYVAAAKAGLSLASVHPNATAVWPPTGIAIAACLLLGVRDAAPAILAAAFVANITTAGSVATSAAIAAGNALEAALGALLVAKYAGGRFLVARVPDIFRFGAIAFIVTPVSATVGVTALALGGYASWSAYWPVWLTWWLGDAAGALVFTPLVVTLFMPSPVDLRAHAIEAAGLLAAVLMAGLLAFGGIYEPMRNTPLAFLCLPTLVWAAMRFGSRETAMAIALLSIVAAWGTHRGLGSFSPAGLGDLDLLQAFMITIAMTALPMSALVLERRRVAAERKRLLDAEQRARADAEAANVAKDEFLAMLGHELRNPVGAITMASHVISRSAALEGSAGRARDVIVRQTEHLTRLIDDLLDVTRITMGKVVLHREPVDLAAAAHRSLDVLQAAGRTSRHRVELAAPADHGPWVEADPTRLEQIVTNLVGNALKYTPAGGRIRISVAVERDSAILRVADTGIGIPADLLPHVFDLFAQGERGPDRAEGGLGVGLTLVKRLVELHGGTIDVRSEGRRRGAEFTVRLPAIRAPQVQSSAPLSRPPAHPAGTPRSRTRRVLIVEDQPDAREVLRMALEEAGHEIFEAADGAAAVEAAERVHPDAAIVDVGLPVFDGYEVARRIRATPFGTTTLLIALTGYGQPEDRRRAEEAGFDVHLVKPVDPARLEDLLASAAASSAAKGR